MRNTNSMTRAEYEQVMAAHRLIFSGWRMVDPADPPADPPDDQYKAPATQADLDRIIETRLARERARFADYDDLRTKAAQVDALTEASKTELERAVDAAKDETTEAERAKSNGRLVAAEARALAAEQKFRNPALAVRAVDLSDVKVDDDGEVDMAAIKTKLKSLSDADPYLVDDGKVRPKPDRSQGGGGTEDKPSVSRGREMFEAQQKKRSTAHAS